MTTRPVWGLLYLAAWPLALLDEPPARPAAPADQAHSGTANDDKKKVAPSDLELLKRLEKQSAGDAEESDPLDRIGHRMRDVQQRLTKFDPGDDTQDLQQNIVDDIDKLIRDIKKSASSKQSKQKQKRKTSNEQSQEQAGQQGKPNQGAEPKEGNVTAKPGSVSDEQRKGSQPLVRDVWGHLPDKLKEEMQQAFKESDLPKYRELIEQYFRAIAEQNESRR